MESFNPLGSQENALPCTAASTDGEEPTSSPIFTLPEKHTSCRQRKPPTITPRSFTRFFTPKSSLKKDGRVGASRQALRDITAQASNRKGQRRPTKDTIRIYEEDQSEDVSVASRKRKLPEPLDVPSDRSSPLKRIRNQSLELSEEDSDADSSDSGDEVQKILQKSKGPRRRGVEDIKPVMGSRFRGGLGRDLRREVGAYGRITKPRSLASGGSKDWQHETANFYTGPEDSHLCQNITMSSDHSIPFCTASCNSKCRYRELLHES